MLQESGELPDILGVTEKRFQLEKQQYKEQHKLIQVKLLVLLVLELLEMKLVDGLTLFVNHLWSIRLMVYLFQV